MVTTIPEEDWTDQVQIIGWLYEGYNTDRNEMVYDGNTITMLQDALIKCLEGKTSFEEVYRTIEIENEDDDNYENEISSVIQDAVPKDAVATTEESDDLLDTSVKKNDENDISSVVTPPAFTAADFMSDEEKAANGEGEENKDGEKKEEAKEEKKEQPSKNTTPAPEVKPAPATTEKKDPATPQTTIKPATPEVKPPITPTATTPQTTIKPATPEVKPPLTPNTQPTKSEDVKPNEVKKDEKVVITANGFNSNVPKANANNQDKAVTPNKVVPVATQPSIKPVAPIAPVAKPAQQQAAPAAATKPAINSVLPITPNQVVPYTVPKVATQENNTAVSPIPKINTGDKK